MSGRQPAQERLLEALDNALIELELRLRDKLSALDPWAADFGPKAWSEINRLSLEIWPALDKIFLTRDRRLAYRQAWAAQFTRRVGLGLLYRAGISAADTVELATHLRQITLERWKRGYIHTDQPRERTLVTFLLGLSPANAGVPDLGDNTAFKGSIRLRYCMARAKWAGATWPKLLEIAATQPGASSYQRRKELIKAVHGVQQGPRTLRRLNATEFALLTPQTQRQVLAVPQVWPAAMARELTADGAFAQRATQLMAERDGLQQVLAQMMVAVRSRRLPEVQTLLEQVPETPIAKALMARLRDEPWGLSDNLSHPATKPEFGPWEPMSTKTLLRLQTVAPAALPVWWALQASEFASFVAGGGLGPAQAGPVYAMFNVAYQDWMCLQRTWTQDDQLQLVRAGHGNWVAMTSAVWGELPLHEMPQALSNLGHTGWQILAWRLKGLPDARPWLRVMAQQMTQQKDPEETKQLRELAQSAIDMHWRFKPQTTWAEWTVTSWGCEDWEQVEAAVLRGTVPLNEAVKMFANHRMPLHPGRFQEVIARSLHKEDHLPKRPMQALKQWLARDPLAAKALCLHAPEVWLERLARNKGTAVQTLDVLLGSSSAKVRQLARRNRLVRVRALQTVGALDDALNELRALAHSGPPALRRDAALHELAMLLGEDFGRSMQRVTAYALREAPSGQKLDRAYARYTIPKRNGSERLISAPQGRLKHLQRMILERVLNPLTTHPAAYGFVPGRNIADNAQRHVGQAVVVNADIQDCFGSVKWPLVLHALRTELSGKMSSMAISLLVDVCTAAGALPTGAPTSPALLNLVLKRTDEILHNAAQRVGATYTRYADDLTFSGGREAVGLLKLAKRTLAQIGLALDPKKTNIFRRGRRQLVTGLVVNEQVSVPRADRRKLRAALHRAQQGETAQWEGQPQDLQALRGRVAFVSMVRPEHGAALVKSLEAAQRLHSQMEEGA